MAMQERSPEKGSSQQGGIVRRGWPRGYELFPSSGELFLMNPFSLLRRVTEEMNRAFGETGLGASTGTAGTGWMPAIEVNQREGKYIVRAELPGVKPENVRISVEDDMLILEGERSERKEEEGDGGRRSEIRYGRFYRAIPLPEGAQTDQAQARFEDGVLMIETPVAQQTTQRKEIPVTGSTGTTGAKSETGKGEPGGKKAA